VAGAPISSEAGVPPPASRLHLVGVVGDLHVAAAAVDLKPRRLGVGGLPHHLCHVLVGRGELDAHVLRARQVDAGRQRARLRQVELAHGVLHDVDAQLGAMIERGVDVLFQRDEATRRAAERASGCGARGVRDDHDELALVIGHRRSGDLAPGVVADVGGLDARGRVHEASGHGRQARHGGDRGQDIVLGRARVHQALRERAPARGRCRRRVDLLGAHHAER